MAIAITLREYLSNHGIRYDAVEHDPSSCSLETANKSHISGDSIAKAVLLKVKDDYLMAVLPATHHINFSDLDNLTREKTELATEGEIGRICKDCEVGAMPPVGQAYGIDVVYDESLAEQSDVYLEAGDHATLVHLSGDEFTRLMAGVEHGHFSRHD